MKRRAEILHLLHRPPWMLAGLLAVALAGIEVVVDWLTWIELNEAIVYTLPLILAGAARNRRLLWGLTIFLGATTFGVYYVQMPPGTFSFREPYFIDRGLAVVTLFCTAGLLHAWTLAIDAIDEQARSIRVQNEKLNEANRQLLEMQEEITRQNEELDRRRQDAEAASSRKSQLLASVSHDIRSPLHAINLMAQVIRNSAGDPVRGAEVPALVERLQKNVLSVGDLVNDVLDISSIDSGTVELHVVDFDLAQLAMDECRALMPLAESRGLYLKADLESCAVSLRTDRHKLARSLGNLIANAIKFTETGGVSLTAEAAEEGGLIISVRDTGIGISPEDHAKVFDEFSRLDASTASVKRGWGLGLAICRRLVNMMGGSIRIESEPGRGSTFSICLPASAIAKSANSSGASAGSISLA